MTKTALMCHDQDCTHKSWPRLCSWVITKTALISHDQDCTHKYDQDCAHKSWPRLRSWVMTKTALMSHDQDCAHESWPRLRSWPRCDHDYAHVTSKLISHLFFFQTLFPSYVRELSEKLYQYSRKRKQFGYSRKISPNFSKTKFFKAKFALKK